MDGVLVDQAKQERCLPCNVEIRSNADIEAGFVVCLVVRDVF